LFGQQEEDDERVARDDASQHTPYITNASVLIMLNEKYK
jgi:hypothetical protein